jgi:hypothetical protein
MNVIDHIISISNSNSISSSTGNDISMLYLVPLVAASGFLYFGSNVLMSNNLKVKLQQ